ncbi:MAG: PAS domain S-box protein [Thermoflexaceae bacterium]|nr:PAS domain S-box protein [Thermoflexaceae bacterium]
MRVGVTGPRPGERARLARWAAACGAHALACEPPGAGSCAPGSEWCDVVLIDADGDEAAFDRCREVVASHPGQRPYIILVNLPPGPECAARALDAGADDILDGPIDEERLATRLEVARARVAQRGTAPNAPPHSKESYRDLIEHLLDAAFVLDASGRFLDANRAACEMTGYSRDELLSMPAYDLAGQGEAAANPFRMEYLAGGGALSRVEQRVRRKDGSTLVCETSVGGLPGGQVLAISRDITGWKNHEAALRAAEERFRALYEKTPIMLHSIDGEGRVVAASDHILDVLGYTREEVLGRLSTDFVTPESAERARAVGLPELLRTGSHWNAPYQMVKRNGETIDVLTSSFMLAGQGDRPGISLSVSVDVTAQRRAERALRESEERLRLILDVNPDLVGWIDLAGKVVFANAAHWEALGIDPAELAGRDVLDMVHPEDLPDALVGMQRAAAGEPELRQGMVVRFRRADGSWAPLEMRARALHDAEGKPAGTVVASRDVSERLAYDEALRAAGAFRDLVMESATNAIFALDLEGRFTFVNRRATEITGFPEEELLGQVFGVLFDPGPLALATEQLARAAVAGERVTEYEIRLRQKGGSSVTITFSIAPLVVDGAVTGVVGTAEDITARKLALEALHERERALTTLVANLPGVAYRCRNDRDWTMEFLSDGCFALTGYPAADFVYPGARAFAALQHPDDREAVWVAVQKAVARREPFELSYRITTAWDEERRLWERGQGVFDDEGNLLALEGFIMDVTERERALEMLHQSEERHRRLVETSPNAIAVHQDGTILYVNAEALRLLGTSSIASVAGRHLTDFIDEVGLERARDAATGQDHHGPAPFVEVQVRRLDGSPLDVELSSAPAVFEGRLATQTVVRDISERRRAEEALRLSEEHYRSLVESTPVAMVVHEGGIVRYASHAALALYGVPPGTEVEGLSVARFVRPEEIGSLAEEARLLAGGAASLPTVERRMVRWDGEPVEAEVTVRPTHFKGRPATLVVLRDLAEQRRAEEVVRRTSEQYRRLVQMSPVAMAVVRDSCIAYANDECVRVFGAPSLAEAIGRPIYEFVSGERREEVELWVAAFLEDGVQIGPFETRARRWNGESFDAEASATAITYDGAQAALLVVRDLSEQKRAEEERLAFERNLLESQKLESLGVLAGGVAHDFNNLLVAIMGNVSLSLMEAGEASPLRPYLEEIETASQRAADLARQMLAYSGKGRLAVSRVQVNELVNEMGKLVSVSIPRSVMLEWQLAGSLPPVEADATQLRQVVMNLVINAAEAIGERDGVIRISTGVMQASQRYLQNTIMPFKGITEGEYVFFEVADTGAGMDPETVERMFDPFFTTKFTGRGLGMAAVLGIVRGHRGAIRVESAKGMGTTIRVLLPPAGAGPPAGEQPSAPSAGATSRGHVLVIDDEAGIRAVASRMLERMGFAVTAVADGAAGVESFAANHQGLAAVLLDMTMPRMGGAEAFARFREIAPGVPVVAMSGFSEEEALSTFQGDGPRAFLQKPFSMGDLEAALGRTLAPGG